MEENRYKDLKKKVDYLNLEGFAGEDNQFLVFRNPQELIEAIRNNKVPNIQWTEENENRWQKEKELGLHQEKDQINQQIETKIFKPELSEDFSWLIEVLNNLTQEELKEGF